MLQQRLRLFGSANSVGTRVGVAVALVSVALLCTFVHAQTASPDQGFQSGTDFVATRTIPVGTVVKVILLNPVSSISSERGDLVKAKVAPDDDSGLPKSVIFVGHVHDALPATVKQPGHLALRFDGLAPAGRWEPAPGAQQGFVDEASADFDGGSSASGGKNDVGIGAAAGAVIGGSRKRKLGDVIEGGILGALGGYALQKATTHPATDIDLKEGQEVTILLKHPVVIKTELIAS